MNYEPKIEHLCEVMHDAYEKAAVGAGWETQKASQKAWANVPEANKSTMRVAVRALLSEVVQVTVADDVERIEKAVDAIRKTREYQAGVAFGVPEDAREQFLGAIAYAASRALP